MEYRLQLSTVYMQYSVTTHNGVVGTWCVHFAFGFLGAVERPQRQQYEERIVYGW